MSTQKLSILLKTFKIWKLKLIIFMKHCNYYNKIVNKMNKF